MANFLNELIFTSNYLWSYRALFLHLKKDPPEVTLLDEVPSTAYGRPTYAKTSTLTPGIPAEQELVPFCRKLRRSPQKSMELRDLGDHFSLFFCFGFFQFY